MEFLLQDKGDGGEFTLDGGDIKQDGTFYTAVYISLLGGDCFYNIYSEYKTDGKFEEALSLPLTVENLKNTETAAENLLSWMIKEQLASSIDVYAYGDKDEKINVEITITEPDGAPQKFSITWENEKIVLNKV